MGKRELRKLKSNLGKIDELYGERKALKDKLATAKKDIKKFTFTGQSEEVVQSLSEEMDSIEREVKALESKLNKYEDKTPEWLLFIGLIFIIGIVAMFLSPESESLEDQPDEQGADEVVTENTTSSDEPDIFFWIFFYSCCIIGPGASIIAIILESIKPSRLEKKKFIITRKKDSLYKTRGDLENAKSAYSASINAPKLAEELAELDAEIEELYSEVKHLIPFSDILEK